MATSERMGDGGPAFPQVATNEAWGGNSDSGFQVFGDVTSSGGMTLRDKFADTILPACYAEYFAGLGRGEYHCEPDWREGVAIEAYRMADAMLAARSQP